MRQVAIGVVIWSVFYIIVKKLPLDFIFPEYLKRTEMQNLEFRNRLVSFVHGLVALFYGCYHFIQEGAECGALNTPLQRFVMVFSTSYFIYDLIFMYFEGILDRAMTIHHPLCIFGMVLPLYENISGNFCMLAIFISEISNPAMHIRSMLRETGRRYTKGYEVAEIAFISLYFYGRFFAAFSIVHETLKCQSNHMFLKLTCMGLMVQSYYFIVLLAQILMKRIKEVLDRKKKGVKLSWLTPLAPEQVKLLNHKDVKVL